MTELLVIPPNSSPIRGMSRFLTSTYYGPETGYKEFLVCSKKIHRERASASMVNLKNNYFLVDYKL